MSDKALEAVEVPAPARRARLGGRRMLMFLVPVLLALAGGYFWLVAGRYASTDNAYAQQDMVAIVRTGGEAAPAME